MWLATSRHLMDLFKNFIKTRNGSNPPTHSPWFHTQHEMLKMLFLGVWKSRPDHPPPCPRFEMGPHNLNSATKTKSVDVGYFVAELRLFCNLWKRPRNSTCPYFCVSTKDIYVYIYDIYLDKGCFFLFGLASLPPTPTTRFRAQNQIIIL